ncbi:hypothetical protein U3A55_11430 [Salarchaeum sp. III]|uniref:hypothetical protein n=1 Tax=Salarchaeum sp. III TaxID=3107927 RepID=UPI002EDA9316
MSETTVRDVALFAGLGASAYAVLALFPGSPVFVGVLAAVTVAPGLWLVVRTTTPFAYRELVRERGRLRVLGSLGGLLAVPGVLAAGLYWLAVTLFGTTALPSVLAYVFAWSVSVLVTSRVFFALHDDYWRGDDPALPLTPTRRRALRQATAWLPFAAVVALAVLVTSRGAPDLPVLVFAAVVVLSAAALPAAYASLRSRDDSVSVPRRGVAGWFGGLFLALVALLAAATVASDALGLFDSTAGTALVAAVLSLAGPFSVTRFPRLVARRYGGDG